MLETGLQDIHRRLPKHCCKHQGHEVARTALLRLVTELQGWECTIEPKQERASRSGRISSVKATNDQSIVYFTAKGKREQEPILTVNHNGDNFPGVTFRKSRDNAGTILSITIKPYGKNSAAITITPPSNYPTKPS